MGVGGILNKQEINQHYINKVFTIPPHTHTQTNWKSKSTNPHVWVKFIETEEAGGIRNLNISNFVNALFHDSSLIGLNIHLTCFIYDSALAMLAVLYKVINYFLIAK